MEEDDEAAAAAEAQDDHGASKLRIQAFESDLLESLRIRALLNLTAGKSENIQAFNLLETMQNSAF